MNTPDSTLSDNDDPSPATVARIEAACLRDFAAWAGLKQEPETSAADFAHNVLVKAALSVADLKLRRAGVRVGGVS